YVEKPFSYDLWEGQQMVAAARKYGRMVQVGTQNRSSTFLRQVFVRLRGGELGTIRFAHALVYRARDGIGSVDAPTPPPRTVDYDLWCGPAPKKPLMRKQLHYEWHWFWDTGNGEMGNNGIHVIDVCRWALGQDRTPPRAMSIGGRFGFHDCGETANARRPAATWRTCLTGSGNNHPPRPSAPRSRATLRWPMPSSAAASICAGTAWTSTTLRPRSAPG